MSPYKKFIASVNDYFNSVPALKFLLSAYIFIFAGGGFLFVLGSFIYAISSYFICTGTILMLAGLLLTVIKDDMMTLAITSAAISFLSLVAWILTLVGVFYSFSVYGVGFSYGFFAFEPFFYFLAFGALAVVVFIKSEKFREMRAASASKAVGVPCPKCGGFIPMNAAFCAQCGTPNPGPAQYAPPAPPQYAPQYAPQAAPQYAPPAAPQYAPQYAPPAPPQYAPPAEPQYAPPAPQPEPAPAEPVQAAPAANVCKSCGAELPVGAMFCGKCGTRQ